MNIFYKILKRGIRYCILPLLKFYQAYAGRVAPQEGGWLEGALQEIVWSQIHKIRSANHAFLFYCPNELTAWRANTFFVKEPETLAWIDSFPKKSCIWDIGANVGLYSIYAAKTKGCRVYAFEPSVFNLELLAKNIHINELSDKITLIPMALNDTTKEGVFELSSLEHGGACSTFDAGYDQFGKPIKALFKYNILSMSGNDLLLKYALPVPEYIKIDVDGIEHLILSGMTDILVSPKLKGMLVEVDFGFNIQAERVQSILASSGFVMTKRLHATGVENTQFQNTYNCIFERDM